MNTIVILMQTLSVFTQNNRPAALGSNVVAADQAVAKPAVTDSKDTKAVPEQKTGNGQSESNERSGQKQGNPIGFLGLLGWSTCRPRFLLYLNKSIWFIRNYNVF